MPGDAEPLSDTLAGVAAEYAHLVRSTARRRGLEDADVDEVMQEVRIRLWRALGSSERIASVNTSYVYQTAMSAVCDIARRRRNLMLEPVDTAAGDAALHTPGADHAFERRELGRQIEDALGTLAPAQRPVVRMYLAGYPQAEIQALLGWSEPKTRNILYRGLHQLRETLSGMGVRPGAVR